jgi:hypothetical protein
MPRTTTLGGSSKRKRALNKRNQRNWNDGWGADASLNYFVDGLYRNGGWNVIKPKATKPKRYVPLKNPGIAKVKPKKKTREAM